MTWICMTIVLFALAAVLLLRIKYVGKDREDFFGLRDTTALRGFWCLIVVLVHIPSAHQNPIQDILGSFAYIGVTFFFLISGYGLEYGFLRKKDYLKSFWRKHLPKLLFSIFIVNCIRTVISVSLSNADFEWLHLLIIDRWVAVLLVCYFLFWIFKSIDALNNIGGGYFADAIIAICILAYSVLTELEIISTYGWQVEVLGFLYGVLLANSSFKFKECSEKKWGSKAILLIGSVMILGVLYLKYKTVFFVGSYILKVLLGISIVCMILHLLVRFRIDNRVNTFLGNVSYEIYLIHGTSFLILNGISPKMNSGAFIIMSLFLSVIMAWVIHLLCEKCLKLCFDITKWRLRK